MKRVLIGIGAALLTVGALAGVGRAAYEAGRDDARNDTVLQVVDGTIDSPSNGWGFDGRYEDGDWRGNHGGPFLVFPLLVIGGIGLVVAGRRRRMRASECGPYYRGGFAPGPFGPTFGPQSYLDEWHAKAHQTDSSPAQPSDSSPENDVS